MTTTTKQSSPKTGKKVTTKAMNQRVQASVKDIVKSIEKDKLKDVTKSDVVNSSNSMGDVKDSLDNCTESIKQLDASIDKVSTSGISVNQQIQSIVFDTNGNIDELGVDSIVDYATRLKNQTEGVSTHVNFDKLNVLRVQFASAMKWAKDNEFIVNSERLSLIGVGKKITDNPNTDNPYRDLTDAEKTKQAQKLAESEKSAKRQADADFEDAFVNLSDKKLDSLLKKRFEFKLMRNDTAIKTTLTEVKK